MKRITVNTLRSILLKIQGSTMVGFQAETEPRMRKTGNPFFGVLVKRNTFNGIVNFHYDEGVLRRLEKEGKSPDAFNRGDSWHEPVLVDGKLTPLCQHKTDGGTYLRFMQLSAGEPVFVDTRTRTEVPKDRVKPFLPERNSYGNQGLDDPLKIQTFSLNSIRRISIKGQDFEVIG